MEKALEKNPALAELTSPGEGTDAGAKKEVFPGMQVEEIRALFFNADALKEPPYRIFQLNSDGYRYYYRFNEQGEPEFYPSVTTLLKQVMPTSPFLIEWMLNNGKEGAVEKRDIAAAYGTLMHKEFETLIISRHYDFDAVPEIVLGYMERENVPTSLFPQWVVKIRKDVLAFAQFVRDYNVKPMAVEIGLVHPDYRYAGCIDLPCVMTDPKTGECFTAIVDFKSGRKGFWEEHELQLHLYREMWNVNFGGMPIERLFNFSPKDWRTKPTYNLKDQTDSPNARKLPHLLALATIEDEKRDNTLTIVRGQLDLDGGKIGDNLLMLSLAELIKANTDKKDAPTEAANAPETEQKPDAAEKPSKTPVKRTKSPGPVNTPTEPQKPVKTEIDEKLPWEKEPEPAKPAGPTPEQIAEQAAKENLLNAEMEL